MNIPQIAMPGNKMVLGYISPPMPPHVESAGAIWPPGSGALDPGTAKTFASIDAQSAQIVHLKSRPRFKLPLHAVALLDYLCQKIEITYKNVNQVAWDRIRDPQIEIIVWRRYRNGSKRELSTWLPNLEYADVMLWWNNQRPGVEATSSLELTPTEWVMWFTQLHANIEVWENQLRRDDYRCNCERLNCQSPQRCNGKCGCRGCTNAYGDALDADE